LFKGTATTGGVCVVSLYAGGGILLAGRLLVGILIAGILLGDNWSECCTTGGGKYVISSSTGF
jgi:hypothetical protein